MLSLSHQKHGFDAVIQPSIHPNHLKFVLKICNSAKASDDDACPNIARAIDQKIFKRVCDNLNTCLRPELRAFGFKHGDAIFQRKQWSLVTIDRNADDKFIDQLGRSANNVDMAQGNRVKCSRIQSYANVIRSL